MFDVTIERLVKSGQIEESRAERTRFLWDEIRRLKREKRAFVPAHNYQVPEVQAIADIVGDSFELAVRARNVDARLVVFCGVRFMAEGCYTLAPHLPVYLPNQRALCSLAELDADELEERQEFLRAAGPPVRTMTYVNTYADVKALSDACCTSSNAVRIAERWARRTFCSCPTRTSPTRSRSRPSACTCRRPTRTPSIPRSTSSASSR